MMNIQNETNFLPSKTLGVQITSARCLYPSWVTKRVREGMMLSFPRPTLRITITTFLLFHKTTLRTMVIATRKLGQHNYMTGLIKNTIQNQSNALPRSPRSWRAGSATTARVQTARCQAPPQWGRNPLRLIILINSWLLIMATIIKLVQAILEWSRGHLSTRF